MPKYEESNMTKLFRRVMLCLVALAQITGAVFVLSWFGIGLDIASGLFCCLASWVLVATVYTATKPTRQA